MKASLSRQRPFRLGRLSFPGWRRLQLPLVVALALNGLLVLPALRPSEQRSSTRAGAPADDTPELLRFSRHQSRETALPLVALPSLSTLPPPPPSDLPARPRLGAPNSRRGSEASTARAQVKAADAGAERGGSQERPLARAGAEVAAARMLALALQARPLEGAETGALATLWEQATPTREVPAGMVVPAEGVEWRRLPLAKARGAGLPLTDALAVLSGGKITLLWPESTTLWMLAAAGENKTGSANP